MTASHSGWSGVRVRVAVAEAEVLLPLSRHGALALAHAVLCAADAASPSPSSAADAALAEVLARGGAVRFLAGMPAWRAMPAAAAPEGVDPTAALPDPALAVWLAGVAEREGADAGRVDAARGPAAGLLPRLGAALVAGTPPAGAHDVAPDAWLAWIDGAPRATGTLGATADGWLEWLRRGRLPACRGGGDAKVSLEGRALVSAVSLAGAHRRLQTQFDDEVTAARLEATRELAYGAGHEINNPLANIATRAQTLLVGEHDPERRRRLSTIVDQAFRARDLIGGLMLFARPPRPQPARVDADRLVAALVARMQGAAAARGVRLEHRPAAAAVDVWVDAAQLEDALRAVVANGIEALGDGGRVAVEVGTEAAAGEGSGTVVVVDDGAGMDGATRRRAFDPFFSGREAGRGAGLGLSKARRFIEVNGGRLDLESRPGAGTRVTFRLPLAAAPVGAAPPREPRRGD